MTPKLTLFRANKACSLTPHVLLRELNIPFETVLMIFSPNGVKSADGSLTSETYRKIHPEGFIPALRTDDQVITENPAITTYIASLAPERNLFGKDDLERAMVYHWLCWLSGTLHGYAYAMILRPGRFSADEGAHAGIVQQGRKKVEECYARIEWSVQGEHIVGDALTIADVNLCVSQFGCSRF